MYKFFCTPINIKKEGHPKKPWLLLALGPILKGTIRKVWKCKVTKARHTVVREGREGTYHCMTRCVRRAFLCGYDDFSGQDYEHRKEWIRLRLKELAGIFAVDVCGYAVMSNHLHVILRNRPEWVTAWSDEEVATRWRALFPMRRDPLSGPPWNLTPMKSQH